MTTTGALTPRQLAVAALIADAKTDQRIAAHLGINDRRVRQHIAAIADKLEIDRARSVRIQIALWFREHHPVEMTAFGRVR